ncbi:MAG: hypothetical protein ACP5UA_00065 [Candidatus Hydrogenedens sp.]
MLKENKKSQTLKNLFWRNFFLFFILIIVIGVSWWFGSIAGKYSLHDLITKPLPPVPPKEAMKEKEQNKEETPPFFIYVGGEPCSEVAQKEFMHAKEAGIVNYIIDVPFPWRGSDDLPELFRILQCINDVDPHGKYWIYLDLNPPNFWFSGKKSANMIVNGEIQPYACFNAPSWKKAIEESFVLLISSLRSSKIGGQVGGYILGFLKNRWWISPGLDESEFSLTNFNKWIQNHYPSAEERIQLFGADTLEPSLILDGLHKETGTSSNYLNPVEHRILINYRRFFNESLANSIGFCAMTLRQLLQDTKAKIYIPYGLNMETADTATGQFSLDSIVESDVDGFILPISYINRGLGESGGPSGTIETLSLHGKDVLLFDDTRTGISFDASTRQIVRVKGVRAENIFAVQKRNMGLALVHNAGLIWTDPEGKGWLLDVEQWDLFEKMIQISTRILTQEGKLQKLRLQPRKIHGVPNENAITEDHILPRLQVGKFNTEEVQTEYPPVVPSENILWEPLAMIIDERAMHLLSPKGIEFYSSSIANVRDQLLKVGLPIEFYLMQDLLDERIPKKLIYFIFNLYPPTEKEIQTLHRIFETDKSIVIWYYLPTWGIDTDNAELVRQLTQIDAKLFDTDISAGSVLELEGRWINKGDAFGEPISVSPLFYIEDENADVIARYQSNGKPSIAVKTINDKWVSVFYAEPTVNHLAMREILSILEVPTAIAEGSVATQDTLLVGTNMLVLHTKGIGDRILQFNQFLNIENLFQPEQKWFERETLLLSLGSGETVFLFFQPQ